MENHYVLPRLALGGTHCPVRTYQSGTWLEFLENNLLVGEL